MKILAFDIGGTAIKIGVINEKGEILESRETPTLAKEGGEALINRILNIIGEYKNIDRVGISTAGQVDHIEGKIIFASENLPGWTGMEIKKRIEEVYNIPVVVENDVNAAAIGEAFYGAAVENNTFLCLAYGTGIGGAIVENGKIYRGAFGSAGEFGHTITHVGGRNCTCGGRGCYETYASTSALVNSCIQELSMKEANGRAIFELFEEGNEDVKKILEEWLFEVVIGLVNFVHIFNPSLIVLGGGIMTQPYIIKYIQENLPKYVMPNYSKVNIKSAKLGNNAGILGAAHLAIGINQF
jgi:glucokinase